MRYNAGGRGCDWKVNEMQILERKVTIAVLWLLQVANYVAYILIGLFETEPFGAVIEPGSGPTLVVFYAWKRPSDANDNASEGL